MYVDGRTPEEVIKGLRALLVGFAAPTQSGPIRAAHEGEPVTFGGEFPAGVGMFIRASGQHRKYLSIPEEVTYSLRIYEIAVGNRAIEVDGSREAEDALIAGWSQWVANIAASGDFRAEVLNWDLGALEVAAQDRFGRLFTDNEGTNNLLRLACDLVITL